MYAKNLQNSGSSHIVFMLLCVVGVVGVVGKVFRVVFRNVLYQDISVNTADVARKFAGNYG